MKIPVPGYLDLIPKEIGAAEDIHGAVPLTIHQFHLDPLIPHRRL
jgi:hypothetical protein